MIIIATRFYTEKSSMSNSTHEMPKRQILEILQRILRGREISRDLQKMEILENICM